MSITPSSVAARRERVARVVGERGHIVIAELALELGVSEMTVRRDVAQLEQDGRVVSRTRLPWPHGKACLIPRKTRTNLVRSMDSLRWWRLNLLTRSRGASLRYRSQSLKDWRFPRAMRPMAIKDL